MQAIVQKTIIILKTMIKFIEKKNIPEAKLQYGTADSRYQQENFNYA